MGKETILILLNLPGNPCLSSLHNNNQYTEHKIVRLTTHSQRLEIP